MYEVIGRRSMVNHVRQLLDKNGYPRLQMMLIVSLTGAAGFAASFFMLRAGMNAMWLRYPLAVGVAYLAFLFMLWMWLRTSANEYASVDVPVPSSGGGRSRAMDEAESAGGDTSGLLDGALADAAQADEFAIPFVAIVIVASVALSMLWMVHLAPLLFAELLVDGALAAGLYRRLRRAERQHWLKTAVRMSWKSFAAVAIFLCLMAGVAGYFAPEAKTLGQLMGD